MLKEPPWELNVTHLSGTRARVRAGPDVVPNAYVDTDLLLIPGQSGSPLFVKLQSGKFLVRGMALGILDVPNIPGSNRNKSFFVAVNELNQILRQFSRDTSKEQKATLSESCAALLAKLKSKM